MIKYFVFLRGIIKDLNTMLNKLFNLLAISLFVFATSCNNQSTEAAISQDSTQEVTNNASTETQAPVETDTTAAATSTSVKSNNGKVVHLNTEQFIDQIFDYKSNPKTWVYKGDLPAIIDFYAEWCQPCKRVAPIMDELAKDYSGKINIFKIDTDKNQELAGMFGIRSIPSILFIPKDGQPQMFTGAFPKEKYEELIKSTLLK